MVRTFLKVYMELGSYFLFLQEQIKDIIIQQQQAGGKEDILSSATGPSTARCSKDVTTHQHRPGARPGRPCPVPACSGQPLPGERRFSSVLGNRVFLAKTGCEKAMDKLSLFDSVPDFAQANSMCSFRNWFHFINTTTGEPASQNVIKVRDRMIHYTNRQTLELLSDMHVLQTLPHPCDRSYTHTDFNVCAGPAFIVTETDSAVADALTVTKTWSKEDDEWYARFCDMLPRSETSGFWNPYLSTSGTLHSAEAEIRRCSEFAMCPATHFHVSGRTVDTRRVRSYVANED
jgi:hypothetical protein